MRKSKWMWSQNTTIGSILPMTRKTKDLNSRVQLNKLRQELLKEEKYHHSSGLIIRMLLETGVRTS